MFTKYPCMKPARWKPLDLDLCLHSAAVKLGGEEGPMPTMKEFTNLAEMTIHDKTSGKRMRQILHVFRENKVMEGLTPEKAVAVLEELGPVYVKIGQMTSTRSDVLPAEYCKAFEKLHADVTPMPYETVVECLNEAYGRPFTEVFLVIDPKPLGSASIAQVHKAVLLDGSVVAVKVRRPGIIQETEEDFTLINHILATAEFVNVKHSPILLNISTMVAELEKTSRKELDFTIELQNLKEFYDEYANKDGIYSPKPYPDVSNDAVLVMEYIEGIEIDNKDALAKEGINIKSIANRVMQNFIHQVIDVGFFQADPHAGNILVRGRQIVWIDLGMVGRLSSTQRDLISRLFKSILVKDPYELMVCATGLCQPNDNVNQSELVESLGFWLDRYASANLSDVNMADIFSDLVDMLKAQSLIISPDITVLVRSVVTIEGLVTEIAPHTNVMQIVSEYVIKNSLDPKHIESQLLRLGFKTADSAGAVAAIPTQAASVMNMLERGELTFQMEMKVPDKTQSIFTYSIGILSLALISAGLFVGSSFICFTNMEPKILEVPLLGFFGFIGAFILGVYVIWQVVKALRKMKNRK